MASKSKKLTEEEKALIGKQKILREAWIEGGPIPIAELLKYGLQALISMLATLVVVGHVDNGKTALIDWILKYFYPEHLGIALDSEIKDDKTKTHTSKAVRVGASGTTSGTVLLDTPGHAVWIEELLKCLTGVRIDATLLVVSVVEREFQSLIDGGVLANQIEAIIAAGIRSILIVANKMDMIGWKQQEAMERIRVIAKMIKKRATIRVCYVSAKTGDGFVTIPEEMKKWTFGPNETPVPLITMIMGVKAGIDTAVGPVDDVESVKTLKIDVNVTLKGAQLVSAGMKCRVRTIGMHEPVNATIEVLATQVDGKYVGRRYIRAADSGLYRMKIELDSEIKILKGNMIFIHDMDNSPIAVSQIVVADRY